MLNQPTNQPTNLGRPSCFFDGVRGLPARSRCFPPTVARHTRHQIRSDATHEPRHFEGWSTRYLLD